MRVVGGWWEKAEERNLGSLEELEELRHRSIVYRPFPHSSALPEFDNVKRLPLQ